MRQLWGQYVFRRGSEASDMWERLFEGRNIRLLYIAGGGFDVRAQNAMKEFIACVRNSGGVIEEAKLILVQVTNYRLDESLRELTEQNESKLAELFSEIGEVERVSFEPSDGEDDESASISLRRGTEAVVKTVSDHTDIVLDASSLPRVFYLALMTSILKRLIPDKKADGALVASGVNFQVLVAEDAELDGKIRAEDPSNDVVMVPGFAGAMQFESFQEWPLIWFPILGEQRVNQLQIIRGSQIPGESEICPVLPHPSRDPRRADRLLVEYKEALFDSGRTPTSNILYVHESQPFEAYRQLLAAMQRYKRSMEILGGCRLVVTPFGSKLVTLGAGLACFEMRPSDLANADYGVAIPHVEPTRYSVDPEALQDSEPQICSLLLTGKAYEETQ